MAKEKQWKKTGWYLMALEGDDLLIWDYRKPVRTGKDHRFIKILHDSQAAYAFDHILASRSATSITMGKAPSGDSFANIEAAIKSLPTVGGGAGITTKWGSDYIRKGELIFTDGTYDVSQTVKHVPLCSYRANNLSTQNPMIRAGSDFTDTYVVDGASRNGTNSNANFQTSFCGIFIDGRNLADVGMRWYASHGSLLQDVEIDRFNKVGLIIEESSDDWSIERFVISRLIDYGVPNSTSYGVWVEDSCLSGNITSMTLTKSDVGISFGAVKSINISGFETENVGLPIEFRAKNNPNWDGTAGDYKGSAAGCRITGIRARRNSNDDFVTSTRVLAYVRVDSFSSRGLILQGYTEDAGGSEPYDRVEVQVNNEATNTYPLRPELGYDSTSYSGFDFYFDLKKMLDNPRFRSDNTKMQDSRLVCINNPATITADGTSNVAAEPGLYRIEVPSGGTWNGGALTVYQYSGGPVVPGLNAITAATDVYYHHPGGTMVVDFSGDSTSASSSVDIYFRPWLM